MSFPVSEVLTGAKRVLGSCSEHKLFELMSSAVEVLANTGEFDPLTGYLDICVSNSIVTLPREVDTILAVNIGGHPTIPRDQLYNFHYNGLGDCNTPCGYSWQDLGPVPTLREITTPAKIVAFVEREADAGKEVWVEGTDTNGVTVRTEVNGTYVNGYLVPTVFGYALPASNAPTLMRVTRVRKAETVGSIRLTTFDYGVGSGTLLNVLQWDETEANYRRIKLHRTSTWCRIAFRRQTYAIKSISDLIPLPSKATFMMMLQAMKAYDEGDLARGAGYEATARRWLNEAIRSHTPPTQSPPQVNDNVSSTIGFGEQID